MTPFLQNLLHYPVETAGLLLAPRGIGTMAAMFVVGRVVGRVDPRALIFMGLALVALSLWEMTGFNTDVSQQAVVTTGLIQGLGLGFVFVPLSTVTFSTLAPEFRNQGTALFSLMRNIGSSLGISVVIFLLGRNTQVMHSELVEHVTAFHPGFRVPSVAAIWSLGTPAGRAALDAEVVRQATMIAYVDDFLLMMVVALVAMPLVLILRRPPRAGAAALD